MDVDPPRHHLSCIFFLNTWGALAQFPRCSAVPLPLIAWAPALALMLVDSHFFS